jgi:hypothetical protein
MKDDKYPNLHAIGLGAQLDALERIVSQGVVEVRHLDADFHFHEADTAMCAAGPMYEGRDEASGELKLHHAALQLLFAASCVAEGKVTGR